MTMNSGLLVIDKPAGMTSHDVVDRVRDVLGLKKVGHSGTLDPDATGVLLVGVGKATRLLSFLQTLPKTYTASVRFGITTDTQDAAGEVIDERTCAFDVDDLEREAARFVGEISQLPPMVSAVKVGGEPLHKAARRGEEVERKPRKVRIYRLEILSFDPETNGADLSVECSSGTYVRTLAHDLGEQLGCGAHVAALRRTVVGSFTEDEAIALDDLDAQTASDRSLAPSEAMRSFARIVATPEVARDVSHGRSLSLETMPTKVGELPIAASSSSSSRPPHEVGTQAGVPVAILDEDGKLLAVYRQTRSGLKAAAVLEPA